MSVADLQELEEIKSLVSRGQATGTLTFTEVTAAVSELDLEESDVEELHTFLEGHEIELLDEADPRLTPPPAAPVFEHLPEVWVLELSSFQLDGVTNFEPSSATVLVPS
mgnify:CR=1 FL=1